MPESETSFQSSEGEHLVESAVILNQIAESPQEGDIVVKNPGTEHEIKYTVTFAGIDSTLVGANEYKKLDVVKYTYTVRGQTQDYTRTRKQFANKIKDLLSRQDVVKCGRKV